MHTHKDSGSDYNMDLTFFLILFQFNINEKGKKILLTSSKNRNRKVYSCTFNRYCAYWLLQYKAMTSEKCGSQDGTVERLTGFRQGVAGGRGNRLFQKYSTTETGQAVRGWGRSGGRWVGGLAGAQRCRQLWSRLS